jgi:CheY-like chemotaxis protein
MNPSILIVDDDPDNREVLSIVLINEGFVVVTAASGLEALATVAQQPIDLVLLDLIMPDMTGYEVAATMKGNLRSAQIPIIIITALNDYATRIRALASGAGDVLTKPFDRAELCERVRQFLPVIVIVPPTVLPVVPPASGA